jgi:hypothetical protein
MGGKQERSWKDGHVGRASPSHWILQRRLRLAGTTDMSLPINMEDIDHFC